MVRGWRREVSQAPWYDSPFNCGNKTHWWSPDSCTMKLREHGNVRVDKIIKVGTFEQALCKEVLSLLPDCLMGMDIVPQCRTCPLHSAVKQRHGKLDMLNGNCKTAWAHTVWTEAGVLVGTNSLCDNTMWSRAWDFWQKLWSSPSNDYWLFGLERFHLRDISHLAIRC